MLKSQTMKNEAVRKTGEWGGGGPSAPVVFQKFLRFQSRHAPAARRRDRLPVPPVLHVATSKNPLHAREDVVVRFDVTVLVQIQLSGKHRSIRNVPNSKKESV